VNDNNLTDIHKTAEEFSSSFNYHNNEVAIILAAGHGKRIKSQKSKMLHSIWGVPTVERVYDACVNGIPNLNSIIVVGIKALDVMTVIEKKDNNLFAYQAEQKGTGHAVQIGLEKIISKQFGGIVYILPGDMGLLNKETMIMFRSEFLESKSDMMVLTGLYEGDIEANFYGRILRVKDFDANGNPTNNDAGKVIEIMEYKDILALRPDQKYKTNYNGKVIEFSKNELIENREFNSGVYAFDFKKLVDSVGSITSENAQNEIYITDLIAIFNKKKFSVNAVSPKDQYVVMGFNDKTVLKEMERVYRNKVYDKIKNIIEIEDADDFFICESCIEKIIEMDAAGTPLDIKIGKGVFVGKGVRLNYNTNLKKNAYLNGNIIFGRNVTVHENVHLSTFPHQQFTIGSNVEILWGDIIKGNIVIGDNSRIESSVNMTGSDDFPLHIGKNVLIKGTSYLFGSIIEDDIQIEHSVLIKKKVNKLIKRNGEIQNIRFFLPMPSGVDAIESLEDC
jgi:bifunctional UDP-N-acetylglucosamine pyrophosphorylase/glucosamine-1-phosphate N-acetyltransferase